MLPEQRKDMREHTPQPQPPAPAPLPQTLELHPWPRTPETHPLIRLESLGHVTPQKPCPTVPMLWEVEAARNTSDVDVEQQLLSELTGGDSLPDVPLRDIPLPEVNPDGSIGEKWSSPWVAEEGLVVGFGLPSGSWIVSFLYCNVFISGTD